MSNLTSDQFRLSETRHVTNVFVDLCGSTAAGEKLQNNQHLFELLDRWQRLTANIICNYGGNIGASDSDMVMGYFKGIETETLASSRAILAAKRIREETIKFGDKVHISIDVHIGIHSGDVETGIIGPEIRDNYTTIGKSVNIAARLESKANKGEIYVSEQVKNEARICWENYFAEEYLPKGVEQPIKCYGVKSVGFSQIPKEPLDQSEWVFATLEAQALEQIGRDAESFELAKKAACSPDALSDLNSTLVLIPQEICIWTLMSLNQPDEAIPFINRFADCAAGLSAQLECAHAVFYLAECLMAQKKYLEAIAAYDEARQKYEQCGKKRNIADSLFHAGICFQQLGNQSQALQLLNQAGKEYLHFVNNQKGSDIEIGKACLDLSVLLVNDPSKAMDILAIAQNKFKRSCNFRLLVRVLNNMAVLSNRTYRPTDVENYARRALKLARDFDPVDGVMTSFRNIGASIETKCNLGMIDKATLLQKALTETRYSYQQALDYAHKIGREELCREMEQCIQRIDLNMRNWGLGTGV